MNWPDHQGRSMNWKELPQVEAGDKWSTTALRALKKETALDLPKFENRQPRPSFFNWKILRAQRDSSLRFGISREAFPATK
jgi:hypothetical protein